jgi:thioredoxin:protein disulfide reductase
MSSKTSDNPPLPSRKLRSKKGYLLALALSSSSLLTGVATTGLMATSMTVSTSAAAAGLSDLFGSSSEKPAKFLSVDQAFQVTSSTQAQATGTRLAINFDITPEHYVYKDQLKLELPVGVTASAFKFSQKPVSIDDPTYGQVPVFDQANMVATTTLTSSNGESIDNGVVTIGWQGCAKAGLCYPPEKIKTTVSIDGSNASTAPVATNTKTTNADNSSPTASASQEVSQA